MKQFVLKKIILPLVIAFSFAQAQTVPGTLSSSATVCANNNSGILSLSGQTGNVIRWEYSLNGFSLWTTISNTSTSYNYVNLSQTTYFRVVVQTTGFPALTSNTVTITANANSNAGTATSSNASECIGNTAVLNLSGQTGTVLGWEFSVNNGASWNTIANSNDSLIKHFQNISSNTLFHALVKNGVCPNDTSNALSITATPLSVGGMTANAATVCAGNNNATVTLSGHTGNVIRWETSSTGLSPWTTINNTTSSLTYNNLLNTTWYRAIVQNGNCTAEASDSVLITVNSNSSGGFITGTQSVCSNLNTGTLNLNANNGSIVQWEYSINNGSTWIPTAVNTSAYTFSNLTQSTLYRVEVSNGICPSAYANTFSVTVNPLPAPSFTFSQACQGKSISFTNTTSGTNTYVWDFKDGNSSNITHPINTYTNAGTYPVKLSATSVNGCTDSLSQNVIVFPKPLVSFTSVDSSCGFNSITFTNNTSIASGSISNYVWSFGDNSANANTQNTSHTYTNANTYIVQLLATSNNACSDSITKQIQVFPKPIADFVTVNVCKKSVTTFTNASYINGGGMNYVWDFGDGQNSALTSPSHLYTNAGAYNVSLICNSNHNCSDTIIKSLYINEQPDLIISANDTCLAKTTVLSQSIIPTVSNYTLNWNMGNGNSVTGNNPSYFYPAAGTYQIIATLTTDSVCVSTSTVAVNVFPLPNVSFSFNNVCSADSAVMNNISFISSGTLTHLWDFGNGNSSALSNPSELYASAGTYIIQLTSTSDKGCVDSLSKPISIYPAPISDFTFANECDGNPISFTNTSSTTSGTITSSVWNFGDNTNSTLVNPVKQYLNYGTYNVNLESTSSNGCKSNITKTVDVYEGAIANFSFVNQCANISIPFTNTTTLNNGTFNSLWSFGDGDTSSILSPGHLYANAGAYQVQLIVTTNNGCVDSISKFVQSYGIPNIFGGTDTIISKGYGILLNASGASSYAWSPATGLSNPTIGNPTATPDVTTTYIVEGTSANGCIDTDTITITVEDDFLLLPYNIVTPNANGKNDFWYIKNIESYPQNKVLILDEWGVVVYEKNAYANEWEGKNKKGEQLPDGTYYYILSFENSHKVYKGFITLLRNNQ